MIPSGWSTCAFCNTTIMILFLTWWNKGLYIVLIVSIIIECYRLPIAHYACFVYGIRYLFILIFSFISCYAHLLLDGSTTLLWPLILLFPYVPAPGWHFQSTCLIYHLFSSYRFCYGCYAKKPGLMIFYVLIFCIAVAVFSIKPCSCF
jgi:hypothetical protein